MPTSVKYLSKKAGMGIDILEMDLKESGWIGKNETLLELLKDPESLKRNKLSAEILEKPTKELTEAEKRLKEEMEYEPEAPPEGDYITINAEDLPKGKKLTLLEDKTARGWDIYEVTEKDPFSITLMDGQEITLKPLDKVQVMKEDVGKVKDIEIIDEDGTYIDRSKTKVTEKDGLKATYYGVYRKDGAFKAWKTKAEIEKIKTGKGGLDLKQEYYGKQAKVEPTEKMKQRVLGLEVKDKTQPSLFKKPAVEAPKAAYGDQTKTSAFKKWFGDSKVVDENGEPLVVYHGTDVSDIKEFRLDKLGINTAAASARMGFFFTNNPRAAGLYPVYPKRALLEWGGFIPRKGQTTKDIEATNIASRYNKIADKFDGLLEEFFDADLKNHNEIFSYFYKENKALEDNWNIYPSFIGNIVEGEYIKKNYGKLPQRPWSNEIKKEIDKKLIELSVIGKEAFDRERKNNTFLSELFKTAKELKIIEPEFKDYKYISKYSKRGWSGSFMDEAWDASKPDAQPSIYPVYLSIQNPFVYDYGDASYREKSFAELISKAKEGEHDGVIFKNTKDPLPMDVYIAFEPTQIKSATANIGTFDPTKPSILEANKEAYGSQEKADAAVESIAKEIDFRRDFQEMVTAGQELIDEIKEAGLRKNINLDGTITIFHGTSVKNADKIMADGRFEKESFFSPLKGKSAYGSEGAKWYGKGGKVLSIKVDARDTRFAGTGEIEANTELIRDIDGIWRSPERIKARKEGYEVREKRKEISDKRMPDRVRVKESKVVKELRTKKRVDFTGRKLTPGNESQEIAEMFQVYRSPKLEILHTIYTAGDGTILGHNAMTSGQIDYVSPGDMAKYTYSMKSAAKRLRAAKVHVLHNHPSGNEQMSPQDMNFAAKILKDLGTKMGDFIVIDHGKFAKVGKIEAGTGWAKYGKFKTTAKDWTAGKTIVSSEQDMAAFGRNLAYDKSKAVFVYLDSNNAVQGWTIHSKKILAKGNIALKNSIQQQIKAHDAAKAVLIADSPLLLKRIVKGRRIGDWLIDVQDVKGNSLRDEFPDSFRAEKEAAKQAWGLFAPKAEYGVTEPDIRHATKKVDYKELLKRYEEAPRPKESSVFEKEKDDWFGNKDWAEVQHTIERGKLQDAIRDTVSKKKNIFGKKIFDKESRDTDAAIHLYLDLKRNPEHREKYYKELPAEWKKIIDKIDSIEANPELKVVADHIRKQGDITGKKALDADVIRNQIENHVNRLWKKRSGVSEKVYTDALQKFKTKSRHAKHRVFDTILEGLALKDQTGKYIFDLQIRGATSNLQVLKDEISRVIEDKKLITEMRKIKTEDGDPLLSTHRVNGTYVRIKHPNFKVWEFATKVDLIEKKIDDSTGLSIGDFIRAKDRGNIGKIIAITDESVDVHFINKKEGTEKTVSFKKDSVGKLKQPLIKVNPKGINFFITDEGTILEKRELYAPEKIARDLNKILGVSRLKGVKILGAPVIDILTKYNAIFKSWILVTSFFHHQAFLRSYYLPTQHKTREEWNPFKAYKMGKKAIEDMTPEIELLVRNGLTMFKVQDWEESVLRREDTVFGKILDKSTTSKAIKDKISELRERQANFLFGNFGAALKTQAALIELRNMTRKHPDMDVQERAKMVARLINDDFGGLHLGRMSRDPTIQHIMRLGLLAPDWCCDSKTRAMTKTGWKYYHELNIDDEIMIFDPKTKKNKWGKLNDMYVNKNYNGKMIQINNFNRAVVITPEHTCYVYNSTTKRNDIVKACELQTNHQIPRCADFELPTKEIYDDIYIKLVGWFVTDGYTKTSINKLSDGSKKEYRHGKITQSKPDMVAVLQKFGMKEHIDSGYWNHDKFKANHYKHTFTIPEKHFKQIQEDGLCDGLNWKFLNKLSKRQVQLLYDTMFLGDGTGQKRFCGKEKEVFYMTLIQTMLGLPTTFYQQEENCWRTRWITRGRGISCGGHHDNKTEIDYTGTIWCPSVDTGFWLAEREGLIFITGNTESNVRTMVKAFRSRGGPEETAMYRRFWTSAITKGLSAVFVANILMSTLDDDDFEERYKKSWKAGHFRWLDIDITPVYKMFGGESEARKYFSFFGHFRDPLKFIRHPIRSLHHKGSVIYGTFHEAMAGTDWKGHRFTTLSELVGVDDKGVYLTTTKTHKKGDPKGGRLAGKLTIYGGKGPLSPEQIPSYIASQLIGVQPIQVQNLIAMLTGEVAAFDGIARSLGMHTGTTYPTRKSIREEFIEEYIKLRKTKKSLKNLREKVKKYNLKHKENEEETISWKSIGKAGYKRIIIERQELRKYRRK